MSPKTRSRPKSRRKKRVTKRIERVLVVYKKSAYQRMVLEKKGGRVAKLLAEGDASVDRLVEAHEAHVATVARAKTFFSEAGVKVRFRTLSTRARSTDHDLVVTLGGDGTLLWASHVVGPDTPMVAINTAPADSVGYFCAGDDADIEQVLGKALDGRLTPTSLTRMQVDLGGRVVSRRVLNDALFSHECPAATTRYLIRHRGREEEQRSSGLWIGPAAGSTAAQRSAGGKVLPIQSKRLQYVIRELYEPDGARFELRKGLVQAGDELVLRSKTPVGKVYLDGPHRIHDVRFGEVVRFTRSDEPLTLLGLRSRARA